MPHPPEACNDHAVNPKYICPKCAREIRNFQKLRVSKDKFKKQKCDKKFIPRLAPSETDCEPSKCSHSKYNIGVLKNIWLSLDLKLQCLFLLRESKKKDAPHRFSDFTT